MTTSLVLCTTATGNMFDFSGFGLVPAPKISTKLLKFQCYYLLRKQVIHKPENRRSQDGQRCIEVSLTSTPE